MGWARIAALLLASAVARPAAASCGGPFVLFFAGGSSAVVGEGERVLDRAAAEAVSCAARSATVEGNVDATEPRGLGLRRAQAVRAAHAARGVRVPAARYDNGTRKSRVMAETAEAQNRYALITFQPGR
jgi:outer membrane protein OmpA-like peptidoglycan-associated protein